MGRLLAGTVMTAAVLTSVAGIGLLFLPLGFFVDFVWPLPAALAWDGGVSLLFFLQHSVMVRRPVRAAMGVPDHYQGAVYAIASGVVLTAVMLLWQDSGEPLLVLQGPWRIAARTLSLGALVFLAWGAIALRGFDPCGVGPIRAHLRGHRLPDMPFVVRGPYRWVRHPLYCGIAVLFWTNPDITPDRLLFNVLWTAWIWIGLTLEETDLVNDFGDAYRRYQREVPALIPWCGPLS